VINTHHHADHNGGNLKMQQMNVQLIASEDAHHTMATFTGRASDVVSGTVFAVTADWHQAGVGVAVHIRTGDDDCAKAKLELRASVINERLENLIRSTRQTFLARHSMDDRAIANGALTAA